MWVTSRLRSSSSLAFRRAKSNGWAPRKVCPSNLDILPVPLVNLIEESFWNPYQCWRLELPGVLPIGTRNVINIILNFKFFLQLALPRYDNLKVWARPACSSRLRMLYNILSISTGTFLCNLCPSPPNTLKSESSPEYAILKESIGFPGFLRDDDMQCAPKDGMVLWSENCFPLSVSCLYLILCWGSSCVSRWWIGHQQHSLCLQNSKEQLLLFHSIFSRWILRSKAHQRPLWYRHSWLDWPCISIFCTLLPHSDFV